MNDDGRRGSRPGSTFQDMRQKARSGSLRGKLYEGDEMCCGQGVGRPSPSMSSPRTTVTKSPISSPRTGNSPWERPITRKPGAA